LKLITLLLQCANFLLDFGRQDFGRQVVERFLTVTPLGKLAERYWESTELL